MFKIVVMGNSFVESAVVKRLVEQNTSQPPLQTDFHYIFIRHTYFSSIYLNKIKRLRFIFFLCKLKKLVFIRKHFKNNYGEP